jgi:hypothetical protein
MMDLLWIFVPIIVLLLGTVAFADARAAKNDLNLLCLTKLNQKYGTAFPDNGREQGLVLGHMGYGLVFDLTAKKAAIFTGPGEADVVDFDYFRSWQVTYDDNGKPYESVRYSNIRVVIKTSDFVSPILRIQMDTKEEAEMWGAKLSVILNRE